MSRFNLPPDHRRILEWVTAAAVANPFLAERAELDARILGTPPGESLHSENADDREQVGQRVAGRVEQLLNECVPIFRSVSSDRIPTEDRLLYRNGVWFWIYHRFTAGLDELCLAAGQHSLEQVRVRSELFESFQEDLSRFMDFAGKRPNREDPLAMTEADAADVFAFCFQLRRAMHAILSRLSGVSTPMNELRAAVWEAIFTRRLLWSFQYLKDRMANFSTLILGPSGSGKELVAESIGLSQFIPFRPRESLFATVPAGDFRTVNLSALSPPLIESELFGHAKGAFTGATEARQGHLELCSANGVLFLDEIGDLNPEIQVKLLRVLQSREFYPLGSRTLRRFEGRIVSATNQNLDLLVREGRMREDFLYRVGTVVIRVPSLEERLRDTPSEVEVLLRHIVRKTLGETDPEVMDDVLVRVAAITQSGHHWPGNVRELEQCARALLVSSDYRPLLEPVSDRSDVLSSLFESMRRADAPFEEVLQSYSRHAVERYGSYRQAAAKLEVDWRTLKKYADG